MLKRKHASNKGFGYTAGLTHKFNLQQNPKRGGYRM